jgi:hypothetical protein
MKRIAIIVVSLMIGLAAVVFLVVARRGSTPVTASAQAAQTVVRTGQGTVPDDVRKQATNEIEARNCQSGGFDAVASQASTTYANAMKLEPANNALASFNSEATPDTQVYDVTFTGRCTVPENLAGSGNVFVQLEALFFISKDGAVVIPNSNGVWEGKDTTMNQPFGTQFESCESDAGCGGK